MLKRNQTSLDQCLATLLIEHNLSSIPALLETSPNHSLPCIEIPRYVRINLLKTTEKKLRLALKQLAFQKLKNV